MAFLLWTSSTPWLPTTYAVVVSPIHPLSLHLIHFFKTATFYVDGKLVAENPHTLLSMYKAGHDIGVARFSTRLFSLI